MIFIQALRLSIEGFTIFEYFQNLYSRKLSKMKIFFMFISVCIILTSLSAVGSAVINFSFSIFLYILLVYMCFNCKFISSIFHNLIISVIMIITEFSTYIFLDKITISNKILSNFQLNLLNALFSKAFFFFLCFYVSKFIIKKGLQINTFKQLAATSILPLSTCIIIFGISSQYFSNALIGNFFLMFGILLLFIANIIILIFYNHITAIHKKLYMIQLSEEKKKIDYTYFKTIVHDYEQSRIMIHDIKNHLLAIQSLAATSDNCELNDYISNLQKSEAFSSNSIISSNKILNAILNYEKHKCDLNKITINIINEGICVNYISDIDICSIVSNLLDNAIEAAAISTDKKINVAMFIQNNAFNVLNVRNTCDAKPKIINGKFISSKANKKYHGVGLLSIESTLTKYHGYINYDFDKSQKIFNTTILIPISH